MYLHSTIKAIALLLTLLNAPFILAQTTRIVRPGQHNLPITEVRFSYNGSTITQSSEASGVIANTTLPVNVQHFKVNQGGTIRTLTFLNNNGVRVFNNNFTPSVNGVGVWDQGTSTLASNASQWEEAMTRSASDNNLLDYLFYDGVSNVPSGIDFDIMWSKGWENTDILIVGERNGNTCFALTPLDSTGNVISGAFKLQFGNCYGGVRAEYDWNIGYCPTNVPNQPMVFTAVEASKFGTNSTIFGFRVDNTGEADPKFFGVSDDDFADNPTNPLIAALSGYIYHDADGMEDNLIDGSGINVVNSHNLYVSLVDQSNTVVSSTEVSTDGYYEFLDLDAGTYSVVLSTTAGVQGQAPPAAVLNGQWVYTGERNGAGSGSDGLVNGTISSISVSDSLLTFRNFGIQHRPESDDHTQSIASPAINTTLALTSANGFPQLSGADNEDGELGGGEVVIIEDTSGMNGNHLLYNGSRVSPGQRIVNFNPDLLEVFFRSPNTTGFSFEYAFEDAAGFKDLSPATYSINWITPLPVEWLYVRAGLLGDEILKVSWATASETDNSHFDIELSTNGQDFEVVRTTAGMGNSQNITTYEERIDLPNGHEKLVYVRIRQIDYNGDNELSELLVVQLSILLNVAVSPTLAKEGVNVSGLTSNHVITLRDMQGRTILTFRANNSFERVNVSDQKPGLYYLSISDDSNEVKTFKIIKP